MMDGDQPLAGQWNFDADNRNKLKKSDLPHIPKPLTFENDFADLLERLSKHGIKHFGEIGESLLWPVTRKQSLTLLDYFCKNGLPQFGRFQDAMTANSQHARPDDISLAQIEGFVRQIIGWREFVRGMYWINMPDYANLNSLDATRNLPDFFWSGDTKMNCMKQSISQSLDYAYAHHIQRLMVIGNFCLLSGIDPAQVDEWYLGIYIDAIEWVEMPNTLTA